ncbi:MAG: phage head-tail connector protein, partial [Synergistaceae bacterium]|nr:phage head-tail connector protein [Synergistaceae bacterium]
MRITTTTAPTVEPVTLTEVKKHLRLATTDAEAAAYTSEDDLLNRLITVARTQAEQETGRAFITQTKTYYLDAWPDEDFIRLPYPTLQSAAVTYRLEDDDDYDETLSTVDTDIVSEPGRVVLQPNESWPSGT